MKLRPSTQARYAIEVTGLRKSYRGRVALDGVDLQVERGEIFALLGPNGAGKTTATEILEGYRSRDSGAVSVLGVDPAGAGPDWRALIGIVLQEARDLPVSTVLEVVSDFAAYYPHPRDPGEVIEAVGLTDKRDSRIARLSGGQRRRLDVALGIIGNPDLLFLDEPTTGFDPEARRRFWKLIAGLRQDGTTVLLTTHYLEEAEHLADRVAVINEGRILDVDHPSQLGGRHLAPSTVRWMDESGEQVTESCDPAALVSELAVLYAGSVPGLTVSRPTLEDVYLKMIGWNA
jgi:ABC-2 type transport system ATP-binding protein